MMHSTVDIMRMPGTALIFVYFKTNIFNSKHYYARSIRRVEIKTKLMSFIILLVSLNRVYILPNELAIV